MIGVVADDITGANDIGIMFAKNGYRTVVTTLDALDASFHADVLIVNTDSRLTSKEAVYDSTRAAARALRNHGCTQFFGKVCSVFRGNVGALFDAVLDEVGESFAPVVLGFPKNGRTTIGGIHFVRGVELKESEFQFDPVHPTHESNLLSILGHQTERPVGLIPHTVLDEGQEATERALSEMRRQSGYAIFDVRHQSDLQHIADVISKERVICGSSAIAEVFPPLVQNDTAEDHPKLIGAPGILIVSGSLTPQTKAQVSYLVDAGVKAYELDTLRAISSSDTSLEASLIEAISQDLQGGRDVVLYASQDAQTVTKTVEAGQLRGLSRVETSAWVSGKLSHLARSISDRVGLCRLIVAGGETSGAVCKALGIRSVRVLQEIAPGLPLSLSMDLPHRVVVLKSGSFGQPEFLAQAAQFIRAWEKSQQG